MNEGRVHGDLVKVTRIDATDIPPNAIIGPIRVLIGGKVLIGFSAQHKAALDLVADLVNRGLTRTSERGARDPA